jgi:hypothetical protein
MVRIADCCIEAKRVTSLFRNAIMPPVFLSLFTFVDGTAVDIERSPGREILDILVRAHDLQASDPRDKIFALLQFGTDTSDVGNLPDEIRPDYSKSTMQVFTDFTRWWITAHKSLRILSAVHTLRDRGWQQMSTTEPLDPSTLPQPAWSFWHGGTSSWSKATLGLLPDTPYHATGSTEPDLSLLELTTSSDSRVLRLAGHRLCTIESIKPFPFFQRHPQDLQETFVKIFDPIGDLKTWIWNRAEHNVTMQDRDRSGDLMDHARTHWRYVNEHQAFPCYSPCLFTTGDGPGSGDGMVGLCPHYAKPGDVIVVLYGGRVPYLLRERTGVSEGETNEWLFIGECYLQDYMDDKAMEVIRASNTSSEVFDIV